MEEDNRFLTQTPFKYSEVNQRAATLALFLHSENEPCQSHTYEVDPGDVNCNKVDLFSAITTRSCLYKSYLKDPPSCSHPFPPHNHDNFFNQVLRLFTARQFCIRYPMEWRPSCFLGSFV